MHNARAGPVRDGEAGRYNGNVRRCKSLCSAIGNPVTKWGTRTMLLPVTLCAAAAAALINLWLAIRCGQVRLKGGILHGDDAGGPLSRRMRAQLNFVENTPFVLVLIAAIELAGRGGTWLAIVAAVYMLGRIAHGIGMDSEDPAPARKYGVIITMLTLLGLSIAAVLIVLGVI